MTRWLIGASIALLSMAAQALPTLPEVEAQVDKGNTVQAESMVARGCRRQTRQRTRALHLFRNPGEEREVCRCIAARLRLQGRPIRRYGSTKPDQFRAFEQMLDREQQRARTPAPSSLDRLGPAVASQRPVASPVQQMQTQAPSPGDAWLGVACRARPPGRACLEDAAPSFERCADVERRRPPATRVPGRTAEGPATVRPAEWVEAWRLRAADSWAWGWQPPAARRRASLAERLLERGHESGRNDGFIGNNAGYSDASPQTDDAARALEDRNVDFGNGGNDWDAGGGGSIDVGGGSDGGSSDGGW